MVRIERDQMKIEAGKRYVRRDGTISGTIYLRHSEDYPFGDDTETYCEDGKVYHDEETNNDLIGEYTSQESVEIKVLRAEVAALKVECERLNEVLKLVVPNVNDVVKAVAVAQAIIVLKGIATQQELERQVERAESFALKCWQQRNN
jgi:hypothetical protein